MKYFLLLTILGFLSTSHACEVRFFAKYYLPSNDKEITTQNGIISTTCSNELSGKMLKQLSQFDGVVNGRYLERIFKEELLESVTVLNDTLIISTLDKLLNAELPSSDRQFFESKLISNNKMLALNDGETIAISCKQCEKNGPQSVELTQKNPLNSTQRTYWLNTQLRQISLIVLSTKPLTIDSNGISVDALVTEKKYVDRPEEYPQSKADLLYYKLNKSIPSNRAIKWIDLIALTLVNMNTPTTVILKSGSITLTGQANPLRPGKYNEMITLKSIPSGQIISGRVVDFNKVIVEL